MWPENNFTEFSDGKLVWLPSAGIHLKKLSIEKI
jgi:hypothetical protein